ncbi:RecQ family ATP-dependent DNA helicase [Treponema sp.]|uniref:RecQ family ATP-dependent DNA helicase n=1 Tax=Treponema sp. TaxID=166 RepID=UPI00257CFACE|nr:RecQ family ATP-dependent DNA helicase [Treponema sp.]MBE6353761.1 ATP-dependent DNA helicase RecQ [Treponema sp.]
MENQEIYKETKMSQQDEPVDDPVLNAARKAFKINYLYPWQRIVIANIMDAAEQAGCRNKINNIPENNTEEDFPPPNQIVLLPTGAGKSLCFLVPALLLKGPTLILYPLIALMSDQKRRMDDAGIVSAVLKGGQTAGERFNNFQMIRSKAKVILANPEVLQDKKLIEELKKTPIAHIAIDEAHCVSEWGDSFRPSYLTLGSIIKELNPKCVTAFTATASPEVLARISEILFDGNARIIRSCSDRPNIHYSVINAWNKKRAAFSLVIKEHKPLIIFCGTRRKSEDMARELAPVLGYENVRFYHAGMTKEEKDRTEKWFYPKKDGVLCCTCAFGMGIDKKDIRTVIHLEASPTAESYIQEAGRGGRDGSTAKAILLWNWKDSVKYGKHEKGSRKSIMKKFAESRTCRRQVLLDALGGEQAFCEGCDICSSRHPAYFAADAAAVMHFIRKKNFLLKKDALLNALTNELNRNNISSRINSWHSDDVLEILVQLEDSGLIKKGSFASKKQYGCHIKPPLYQPEQFPSSAQDSCNREIS